MFVTADKSQDGGYSRSIGREVTVSRQPRGLLGWILTRLFLILSVRKQNFISANVVRNIFRKRNNNYGQSRSIMLYPWLLYFYFYIFSLYLYFFHFPVRQMKFDKHRCCTLTLKRYNKALLLIKPTIRVNIGWQFLEVELWS